MITSNKKKRMRNGGDEIIKIVRKPNLHRLHDLEETWSRSGALHVAQPMPNDTDPLDGRRSLAWRLIPSAPTVLSRLPSTVDPCPPL